MSINHNKHLAFESPVLEKLYTLLSPVVAEYEHEIVRLKMLGGQPATLQIMVEPQDGGFVSVDICGKISHAISALMDVEDPIVDPYVLEISSPGIDRPLTRLKDFYRFKDFIMKVQLSHPLEGRRTFKGWVVALEEETLTLMINKGAKDEQQFSFSFDDIAKAKLILNDELIEASQAQAFN